MGTFAQPREAVSRVRLPGDASAASAARRFVRASLAEGVAALPAGVRAAAERLTEDAVVLTGGLVADAVTDTGTEVEITCRLEARSRTAVVPQPPDPLADTEEERLAAVLVEVSDRPPAQADGGWKAPPRGETGRGLESVAPLAASWGVTYRHTQRVVWFRLETSDEPGGPEEPPAVLPDFRSASAEDPAPVVPPDRGRGVDSWGERRQTSFLAEVSELLAGQLDEDLVAALAGQLIVPRLADWCAVWLSEPGGGMRLSQVWHIDEQRIGALHRALAADPPTDRPGAGSGFAWPWPESLDAQGTGGSARAFPLLAGGLSHGLLLIGRVGPMTHTVVRLVEDVARRVTQAVVTARNYTQQTTISRALQRRQLPAALARIPSVDTAIVYEPHAEGQTVGGDFYDLFPMGDDRWCFLLGDVCGSDPEAMSVTGLARHLVRLLAREGHGVESVLERLNLAMAEDSRETEEVAGEQEQPRFLSLLYGELQLDPEVGGARCRIASAGHPLPLWLHADGSVSTAARPQMLLGIDEHAEFTASSFLLSPGETLLCVTDGVTERRRGDRQLDDHDGLAEVLRGCVGMGAKAVAERVRQAAHDFGVGPVNDDLAVLVLEAVPRETGPAR